jgi:protein tyrosine phosphatase
MISFLIVIGLFICAYCRRNWISSKIQQIKLLIGVIQQLLAKEASKSVPKEHFEVNSTDDSATILYERMSNEYRLVVPYSRRYVASMTQLKVELVYENGSRLDITQQPGIPYLFTANELGGKQIVVMNGDTGIEHTYSLNERPKYADETMDEE